MSQIIHGDAVFSACGKYRYQLERDFASGRYTVAVIMLNPSKAGATETDHTITKLVGFCDRLDACRLIVTNVAAGISTYPKDLRTMVDPIGPENDQHIRFAVCEADVVIVAWGGDVSNLRGPFASRPQVVLDMLRGLDVELRCWGRTKHGQPRHPLMLAYATPLKLFNPAVS